MSSSVKRRVRGRVVAQGILSAAAILATAGAHADFVRAKGRVMFVDGDGVKKPFARVQVRLMDSDWDWDEEIARGFTDAQGNYDLSGHAGDSPCIGCGTPDPYVKVVLEDPGRVEVHDILHFTRNAVLTPTHEETAGTIDFGTRTFTEVYPEGKAAILYARAQSTYEKFRQLSGDSKVPGNGGEVAIEIPVVLSAGTPYTTWDTIHWPGIYEKWGTFDHEFGHRIRHAADGDVTHFNNDLVWYRYGRDHEDDEDTNLGFAFNEGWADYFRDQLQPDAITGPWNGENWGDEVEGHVGHKLVDLSAACGDFKPMWQALKANPGDVHSFPEFKQAFMDRKPTCTVPLALDLTKSEPEPKSKAKLLEVDLTKSEPEPKSKAKLLEVDLTKSEPGSRPGTPSKPQAVRTRPPVASALLAAQEAAMNGQLDAMDARARALEPELVARIPPAIRAQDHGVVQRLSARRADSWKSWEAGSRATYRDLLSKLPAMTPETILDGSFERAAHAARRAFLTSVAEPRLRDVRALRRDIASERARTTDAALRGYLGQLDGRYARLETQLTKALASRDAEHLVVPLEILPRTFSATSTEG